MWVKVRVGGGLEMAENGRVSRASNLPIEKLLGLGQSTSVRLWCSLLLLTIDDL
jgi:hypothetical protein